MQNLTLTAEPLSLCQEVDIISSGLESLAVAGLLSSRGRGVRFRDPGMSVPEQVLIKGSGVSYKAGRLKGAQQAPESANHDYSWRAHDLMLVCGRADDYRAALNVVAELLFPGQTVFIVDAPLGTAFELSCLVYKLRKRMAFNVIEMGALFEDCHFEGRSLEIDGLKEQVAICGRSVNETRTGLALGRQLFNGLVPASNVFERGLSDIRKLLQAAARLLCLEKNKKGSSKAGNLSSDEKSFLDKLEAEIQGLGRVMNVAVPSANGSEFSLSAHLEWEKKELAKAVNDSFVLLSCIAELAYTPVPCIDALIERSSKLLNTEFRTNGRKLSDLGLSGMDVREIIELVNS